MKVKIFLDVSDEHGTTMVSAVGPVDPQSFTPSMMKDYKRYVFEVDVPCRMIDGDAPMPHLPPLTEKDEVKDEGATGSA